MDEAERRFSWLLGQRGYEFATEHELERKIVVQGRRPDFYVETRYGPLLVEVESFEEETVLARLEGGGFGSLNAERIFNRIRTAIKHAKRQLKPYAPLCVPMLIVLDSWRQVGIPNNYTELRSAMFGTPEIRIPLASGDSKPSGQARLHYGAGQMFNRDQGRYVSAVAWNIATERFDTMEERDPMTVERRMRLRVMHNPFAVVPLPREMFSAPEDEHEPPPAPDARRSE